MWSLKKGTHPSGPFGRKRKTWFCIIWNCFAKSWFRTRHTFIVSFLHAPWYFPLPGSRLTLARKPTLLEPWQTEMSTYIPKVGLESIQFRSQQAQINQPTTSNISFFHRRSSCFTFGGWEVWPQANISDSCPSLRFELGDAAMTEGAHICNIHIDRCIIYTKYIYILQRLRMKYIDQAVWFSPHFGREKHGLTLLWKNNRASQRNNLAIIFFLTCKAGDTIKKITFLTILKSYAE